MQVEFFGLNDEVAKKSILDEITSLNHKKYKKVSVSFNHDPSFKLPPADFRVLLLWEPKAVMPWQYQKVNYSTFDLVIPMSGWRAQNLGLKEFAYHPYDFDEIKPITTNEGRTKRLVMINSAKFSSGCSSLYGLRRAASKKLFEIGVDYSLYGTNWHMSKVMEVRKRITSLKNSLLAREKICFQEFISQLWYSYPEYKGWVENKFGILSQFQLSLVIENEQDWVTEKVFDSLYAGAIPIYVGPDFSKEFPKLEACVIRANANTDDLVRKVRETSADQIARKQIAIREFLSDKSKTGIGFWHPKEQWGHVSKVIHRALLSA